MTHFVAFDLHSDNACCLIIDSSERIVFKNKFNNVMADILAGLLPFKPTISKIVVEATYNWYWLLDGLMYVDDYAGASQWKFTQKLIDHINDWITTLPGELILSRKPLQYSDF